VGAAGAGAGVLLLRKRIGTPGAMLVGAGVSVIGALVTNLAMKGKV
jgi:hypothetical protein